MNMLVTNLFSLFYSEALSLRDFISATTKKGFWERIYLKMNWEYLFSK